jgi:hypothetical protein
MMHFSIAVKRISVSCQLFPQTKNLTGKLMTELFSKSIGTLHATLSFHAEKTANIEYGIILEDSSITQLLMTMLSLL